MASGVAESVWGACVWVWQSQGALHKGSQFSCHSAHRGSSSPSAFIDLFTSCGRCYLITANCAEVTGVTSSRNSDLCCHLGPQPHPWARYGTAVQWKCANTILLLLLRCIFPLAVVPELTDTLPLYIKLCFLSVFFPVFPITVPTSSLIFLLHHLICHESRPEHFSSQLCGFHLQKCGLGLFSIFHISDLLNIGNPMMTTLKVLVCSFQQLCPFWVSFSWLISLFLKDYIFPLLFMPNDVWLNTRQCYFIIFGFRIFSDSLKLSLSFFSWNIVKLLRNSLIWGSLALQIC